MITVQLTKQEWDAVINCMGYAPGNMCVPLWNKIGPQIQMQHEVSDPRKTPTTNSVEMPISLGENSIKHNG